MQKKQTLSSALIEVQYLPPVAYFTAVAGSSGIVVEKFEHYQKQTYRNRCYINTVHGRQALIVPLTMKHGKVLIKDVRIDHTQKWVNNHWRTIQSAYGKAPFFEHYADELNTILHKRQQFLYDLNMALLTMCLKWLKWNVTVTETETYDVTLNETVKDLRSAINPKISQYTTFYKPAAYYQVFGSNFVENLSLVDLVFCEGPGASGIVQASVNKLNI